MKNTRKRRIGKRYRSPRYAIRFLEDLNDFPNAPSILSEGDSWFGYPFGRDLNDQIAELGAFNIRHFEKAGDELIEDMMDAQQIKLLTKALKNHQFELMIYSGGGNDIVAENLTHYITNDESGSGPHSRINTIATKDRINALRDNYIQLIDLVNAHQTKCPIIVHGYDRILPSDVGFTVLGFELAGPWVKPTLDKKGVRPEHQADVINHIMDLFNDMLKKLALDFDEVHFIDLRGTLKSNEWANEIHPTSKGFEKLAKHYESKLRQLVPSGFV